MYKPFFSIILSVYNHSTFLTQSIESILEQTFSDFELIVINDGSEDNSLEILMDYQLHDNRIKILNNEKNMGLAFSLNVAINNANGIWIVRQDADDTSEIIRLDRIYEYINYFGNKNYVFGSDCNFIDIDGNFVYSTNIFSKQIKEKSPIELLMNGRTLFPHGTAVINKKIYEFIGFYDEDLYYAQDYEMLFRIIKNGLSIKIIPEKIYNFRLLPYKSKGKYLLKDNITEVIKKLYSNEITYFDYKDNIKKLMLYKDNYNVIENKFYLSDYWYSLALSTLKTKNFKKFYIYIFKSLRLKNNFIRYFIKLLSIFFPIIIILYPFYKIELIKKFFRKFRFAA